MFGVKFTPCKETPTECLESGWRFFATCPMTLHVVRHFGQYTPLLKFPLGIHRHPENFDHPYLFPTSQNDWRLSRIFQRRTSRSHHLTDSEIVFRNYFPIRV